LSGRGVSYWTDGKGDERILYVTTGYRLVALNAKTGAMIPSFGKDGIVDLKVGMVTGSGQQIDLETGEAGLHSTPTIVKDVVIVGSSFKEGMTTKTHNNTKGLVRAFDVKGGKLLWTFNTIPRPGEFGNDTWLNDSWKENGNTGVWTQISESVVRLLWWTSSREQPIWREPRLRRSENRPAKMAFPDRASSDMGLRPVVGSDPGRHHCERARHQGRRTAQQRSVLVCFRSCNGAAGLADRGAARRER
jgi:hypothetical protein